MNKMDLLNKLVKERKLELVEKSEPISKSYERKAIECREVAILAFNNGYYESTVTQSYYSMYNTILSLFFKCGIKCENHTGSSIILEDYFKQKKLNKIFQKAKEERIDKQYYVTPSQNDPTTKDSAKEMMETAMNFNPKLISYKNNLKELEIDKIRTNLKKLLK